MDAKVVEIARRHQGTLTDVQYLGLVSALEEMRDYVIKKANDWIIDHGDEYESEDGGVYWGELSDAFEQSFK